MKLKKLASLLLALVMALALAVPAMAVPPTKIDISGKNEQQGKIIIDNAIPGQTYNIYQIFVLDSYSGVEYNDPAIDPSVGTDIKSGNFSYKVADSWKGFFEEEAKGEGEKNGSDFIKLDADGYVADATGLTDENVAEFAKLALAWAKANRVAFAQAGQTAPAAPEGSDVSTVTFDNLSLGYYLIDSSAGALCSLNTTAPNAIIKEKNKEPVNTKEVQEDSTVTNDEPDGKYSDKNDADIGQTVNFKSTIIAQAGAAKYVFHDTMSAGLTFDASSVTVTLYKATGTDTEGNVTYDNGNDIAAANNWELKDYSVAGATKPADGCTFEIEFDQTNFCDTLGANDKIVISYSAVLNENAKVGVEGNPNESKLTYGDKGQSSTNPSKTTTYTWEMNVEKYTLGENNTEVKLADATFTLSKNADGTDPIAFVKKDSGEVYRVATSDDKAEDRVTEITTDASGAFKLEGLDAGTYYLTEIKAPEGYNKLTAPIKIAITDASLTTADDADGNGNGSITEAAVYTLTTDADGDEVAELATPIKVLNNTGAQLPSTGGIGTTIFYIVGGVLAAGAVILLITKRRMNMDK